MNTNKSNYVSPDAQVFHQLYGTINLQMKLYLGALHKRFSLS